MTSTSHFLGWKIARAAPCHPTPAVCCALFYSAHAHRVLIGACNPMLALCLIFAFFLDSGFDSRFQAALAGRSNWVPEDKLKGTPDPGAQAVALMLHAIADQL